MSEIWRIQVDIYQVHTSQKKQCLRGEATLIQGFVGTIGSSTP